MKLKNLYEMGKLEDENNFIKMLNKETLNDAETIEEALQRIKVILEEADKYAEKYNLEKKYLERAKKLIFEEIEVEPENFIVKGFDAQITIDLKDGLNAKPYVKIFNQNFNSIYDEQKYEINEEFLKELNALQRETFNHLFNSLQEKTLDILRKSWILEKKRIEKWICNTPVKINKIKKD
jgi:hypothetical protein